VRNKKGEEKRPRWIGGCENCGTALGMNPSKNMGHESHAFFLVSSFY